MRELFETTSNISHNLEFTYYVKFLAFKHNRHRIIILNYVKLQPEEDEDSGSEYTVQEEDDDEFEGLLKHCQLCIWNSVFLLKCV